MIRFGECALCGGCCKTVDIIVMPDLPLLRQGNLEELQMYMKFRVICVARELTEYNSLFHEHIVFGRNWN